MKTKPDTFDEYIAGFPKETQKILQQIRNVIKKAAPKAEEKISYGMPAFTLNGNLVYFAGYKNHIGFYALPTGHKAFQKELSGYKSGKGSVQFPLDQPMPLALITKIVKFRIKEMTEKAKLKAKATPKKAAKKAVKKISKKEYIKYHTDGTIWAKGKMSGSEMDGYWEWFRKDGTIMRSGAFNKGKQVGNWTTYDKKGKVYKVTKMK